MGMMMSVYRGFAAAVAVLLSMGMMMGAATAQGRHGHHGDKDQRSLSLEAHQISRRAFKRMEKPVVVDARALRSELRQVEKLLEDLNHTARAVRHRDLQARLCHQITDASRRMATLRQQLRQAPRLSLARARERQPAPMVVGPAPADPEHFQSLHHTVAHTYNSRDKLEVLRSVVAHNYLSTEQIISLSQLFYNSDRKLEAMLSMLPRAVDPENLHQLYPQLYNSDRRRTLVRAVTRLQQERQRALQQSRPRIKQVGF
jgi:hypothetical protein